MQTPKPSTAQTADMLDFLHNKKAIISENDLKSGQALYQAAKAYGYTKPVDISKRPVRATRMRRKKQ